MHKSFTLSWILAIALLAGMAGCKKVSSAEDVEKVKALEEKVKTDRKTAMEQNTRPDQNLLIQLAQSYVDFTEKYPEAPETPDYLFKAGELYSNDLNDVNKALGLYEKIFTSYSQHETSPKALFITGYIYNNKLQDITKAKKYYEEFVSKYPTDKMVESAKMELANLGLTDEQILQKLLEKGGSDSPPTAPDSVK